jgi:hypothetical protein
MLLRYAPGSEIAIVSSSNPRAILPEDNVPRVHPAGSEKSSLNINSPIFGRKSGVGETCRVGRIVGVAVAGNHSTVADGTAVGVVVWVSLAIGRGVSTGIQADTRLKMTNIPGIFLWLCDLNLLKCVMNPDIIAYWNLGELI